MSPFTKKPEVTFSQQKRFRFFGIFILFFLIVLSFVSKNPTLQQLASAGAIVSGVILLRYSSK